MKSIFSRIWCLIFVYGISFCSPCLADTITRQHDELGRVRSQTTVATGGTVSEQITFDRNTNLTALAPTGNSTLPPAIPSTLAYTGLESTQISYTWSDVATETSYRLERRIEPNGTWISTPLPAGTTSFNDANLLAGTNYRVRLTAQNRGGQSAAAVITFTTPDDSSAPSLPLQLAAQTVAMGGNATLILNPRGSGPFTIEWFLGRKGDTSTLLQSGSLLTFTLPNVTEDTYIWARISNSYGSVDTDTIEILINRAPSIVSQPQSGVIVPGDSLTLSVSATGRAPLTYQWYRGSSGTTTTPISGATDPVYNTGTLNGSSSFWVRIANPNGTADSTTAIVQVLTTPPANLAAGDGVLTDRIRVTWTAAPNAAQYIVSRNSTKTLANAVAFPFVTTTTFDDTTAQPGEVYFYWVRAITADGATSFDIGPDAGSSTPPPVSPSDVNYFKELIVNNGFEDGLTGWTISGATASAVTTAARNGTKSAILGGGNFTTHTLSQQFEIPANAINATLTYATNIITMEAGGVATDTLDITIQDADGTELSAVETLSNLDKDTAGGPTNYHLKTVNLLPWRGQTIRLNFAARNNATNVTTFNLDDVSVLVYLPSNRSSINLSIISSLPDPVIPYSGFTIVGRATYNDGPSVSPGTATITIGQRTWTAPIYNGIWYANINAPGPGGNATINISATEGLGRNGTISRTIGLVPFSNTPSLTLSSYLSCRTVGDESNYFEYGGPTRFFSIHDARAYSWAEFSHVSDAQSFKTSMSYPSGGESTVYEGTIGTPGVVYDSYRFYAYTNIAGIPWPQGAYAHMVTSNGTLMRSLPIVIGHNLTQTRLAKAVNESGPVSPTNFFVQGDTAVVDWTYFEDASDAIDLKWVHTGPVGAGGPWELTSSIPDKTPTGSYWPSCSASSPFQIMSNSGVPGDWTVATQVKNASGVYETRVTDRYRLLESPVVPPTCTVSRNIAAPYAYDTVTLKVAASDNTALKSIRLYWRDGTDHQVEWTSGGQQANSSQTIFQNIGPLQKDQTIEYWAVVTDTSGNISESAHQSFNAPIRSPDLLVEYIADTPIAYEASLELGSVTVGENANYSFTIRNAGNSDLILGNVVLGGPDGAAYQMAASPGVSNVVPGGKTNFTVKFSPTSVGPKQGILLIYSNHPKHNPYRINLSATGAPSSDANLSNLSLTTGPLAPLFTSGMTNYTSKVRITVPSTRVIASVAHSGAVVKVNGIAMLSGGMSHEIPLALGFNEIVVEVKASDGQTSKTYSIVVTRDAAPGSVDSGFDGVVDSGDLYTAMPADNKVLLGGGFKSVEGVERMGIARLGSGGTLDTMFNPIADGGEVLCTATQSDGMILAGGNFLELGGIGRNHIARMNANGTLDPSFNPNSNNSIWSISVQENGKVLIGGFFTKIGKVSRSGIARLNSDGTLDTSFNPNPNSYVWSTAIQSDGKILIGGLFSKVGDVPRYSLARLNVDGTLDNSFNFSANSYVSCLAIQPDGRILIGGYFTTVGGTERNGIARINQDGSLDTSFNLDVNGNVCGISLQTDGRIVVGGEFTIIGGVPRNGIACVDAYGKLDLLSNPNVSGAVFSTALQTDGQIIVGGRFTTIGGFPRAGIARLDNLPATQELRIANSNRIEWLRGGSSSETQQVSFELSTEGGGVYTTLGVGTRIAGGWELTGLDLPAWGHIRARARVTGGRNNGSSGFAEKVISFGTMPVFREISVKDTGTVPATELTDNGSSVQLGNVETGTTVTRVFEIKNVGTTPLTGLAVSKDGTNSDSLVVTQPQKSTLNAGETSTFTVQCPPLALGAYSANLHIASNDSDESSFDIALSGTGVPSSNANLSGLTLSVGTLSPGFSSGIINYTASVGFNSTSLTITPTSAQANATIRVSGSTVASGSSSGVLSLNVGTNPINVSVTAQNGVATKAYTINVTRRSAIVPGELDFGFASDWRPNSGPIAVQPDGKILIGATKTINGNQWTGLIRLNADGTQDAGFEPQVIGGLAGLTVLPNGKILIGGGFNAIGGVARQNFARLNGDGSLDTEFNPNGTRQIQGMVVQLDGKIVTVGMPSVELNNTGNGVKRWNSDGTLDIGFNPIVSYTSCVARQQDGKILIGGGFTTVGGVARTYLARLNSDGTLDSGFNPVVNSSVYCLAVQADGRILFGGGFTTVNGVVRNRIARLNADGTLDSSFNPNADQTVLSLVTQTDGSIILAGEFNSLGGVQRTKFGRINANGSLDSGLNPVLNLGVSGVAIQADGRILLGGSFTSIDGVGRNGIARLENAPATQSLTVAGSSRVEWLRGGTSPEAERVSFELFTDGGSSYSWLGEGTRITGGWELAGISLPAAGQVRARAHITGGIYNSARGMVETVTSFGVLPQYPEIGVLDKGAIPASALVDGVGSVQLGMLEVGAVVTRVLSIVNTGNTPLTGLIVTKVGQNADNVVVTQPAATSVKTGESVDFKVQFTSSVVGVNSVDLQIGSNDTDESPFDLQIMATGAASNNALLSQCEPSIGILSPLFNSSTTSYTNEVGFEATALTVKPTAVQVRAGITVNGISVHSGDTSASIPLNIGLNLITIKVTADDGTTTREYEIRTTRRNALMSGDLDYDFNPGLNRYVNCTASQADGKTLVGTDSVVVDGVQQSRIYRLNSDGTLDNDFDTVLNGRVTCIAFQFDGKVLIGGDFSNVNGVARYKLARLESDGSLDLGFTTGVSGVYVSCLTIQADGRILVGGAFDSIASNSRSRIARLNPDGSLDTGFNPNANSTVNSVAVQSDGKILIGGGFTSVGGVTRNRIARVHSDGTLDSTFNPDAAHTVYCISTQPTGKILIGGSFFTVGGISRPYLARLNPDGTVDSDFNGRLNSQVYSIALQADRKIIIAGSFTQIGNLPRTGLARLNEDGLLDTAFNAGVNGNVHSVAVQPDEKISVGGEFTGVAGVQRQKFARMENPSASQNLSLSNDNRIEWLRGGTSPEIHNVTFELSTDGGSIYSSIGSGTRITGGWELTGLSLPSWGHIRARAHSNGGRYCGSNGVVGAGISFGVLPSEIGVRDLGRLSAVELASGKEAVQLGDVELGRSITRTFSIINHGHLPLSNIVLTKSGTHAVQLEITQTAGTTVNGGEVSNFIVRFSPVSLGTNTAVIHIDSNDSDEDPFDIPLIADGIPSSNADLSDISLSAGTLAPLFSPETTMYSAVVGVNTSLIRVLPIGFHEGSAIAINGQAVVTGSVGNIIPLNPGVNIIDIRVMAPNASSTKNYTIRVTRSATLVDGDVLATPEFNSNLDVCALAVQPDGKLLVGGRFTKIGEDVVYSLARFRHDATLDVDFHTQIDNAVLSVVSLPNGSMLIGGEFTTVGGMQRSHLARLNADGSPDTDFQCDADGDVSGMAVQADGRVIVAGSFTTVGGASRNHLARLNSDGIPDPDFAPNANGDIYAIAVQSDGKILIGGAFTMIGGVARNHIARLNVDGTVDLSFDPDANESVRSIVEQGDGTIVLGGNFTSIGSTVRNRIARIDSNGDIDADFAPDVSDTVNSIAMQADGRILIGGDFGSVSGIQRYHLARIEANGTLDGGFNPNVSSSVLCIALKDDGKIWIGGGFQSVGDIASKCLAKLENGAFIQHLLVPSANRIEWTRGGTSPEAQHVAFELSTDAGITFSRVGTATRFYAGWELTGLSLPAEGLIRARARTVGGQFSSSSGEVETLANFNSLPVPEISVETPAGSEIADGGSIDLGIVLVGGSSEFTFVVKNTGVADLTGLAITKDGPDHAFYTISANPVAPIVGPNGSTSFTVKFSPNSAGPKTAVLHIANNDYDESSFDITFTGEGLLSSNADLSDLRIEPGMLSPVFAVNSLDYAINLPNATSALTVMPSASDVMADIKVNGVNVPTGSVSGEIPISVGLNTISIVVAAADGVTAKTYTVAATRISGYDSWRASVFANPADFNDPSISGELATPAHDGITNLMKYALALDPLVCGMIGLPTVSERDGYLTLTYRKNKQATDVTCIVQSAESPASENWSSASTVVSQTDEGSYLLMTVQDTVPRAGSSRRFMRLRVTQNMED